MLLNIFSNTSDISSLLPSRKERKQQEKKAGLEKKKENKKLMKEKGLKITPKKAATLSAKPVIAQPLKRTSTAHNNDAQYLKSSSQLRHESNTGRERNRNYDTKPPSDESYWGDAPEKPSRSAHQREDRGPKDKKRLPMKDMKMGKKHRQDDIHTQKESLPTTTNLEVKATVIETEEKIKQQRIGEDTDLLAKKTPFGELGLTKQLCDHLDAIQFNQPTHIQSQAIPALLSGRDALCQAQTGSGKTLSYLLPIIQDLQHHFPRLTRDDGTHAIILAPTRELVLQIEEVWQVIAKPFYWLIATTIMGGAKKQSEKARLRKGCHVVIGTPGRIVDHLGSTQSWILGSVSWFILDEADRLLDLGFSEPIKHLYTELLERADRRPQCALVSATLSKKQIRDGIFSLSSLLLQDPVHVGFDGVQDIEDDDAELKDGKELLLAHNDNNNHDDSDIDLSASDSDDTLPQNNDNDSDSDDEAVKNKFLQSASTLLRKKGAFMQDSSSDSDSDSDDNSHKTRNIANDIKNAQTMDLAMNKLLPKFREKSMNHLGETSTHITQEEYKQAMDTVTTSYATPKTLEQLYVTMSSRHRLVALSSFLRLRVFNAEQQGKQCKMIVFVSTCASVEFLHRIFQHAYWPDDSVNLTGKHIDEVSAPTVGMTTDEEGNITISKDSKINNNIANVQQLSAQQGKGVKDALVNTQLWKLHGNMPQNLRTETYRKFCDATEGVLFCTDVAARGLDLPLIDWIIQYDPPEDTEDYVHRVGRTARIGHSGRAILFLLESEQSYVQVLTKMGTSLKEVPLATLLSGLHVGLPSKSPLLRTERPLGAILQKQLEKLTSLSNHLNILAKASYIAYVRAYAAYPKALKGIFHPRRLHLGEVAHSFALTETPSEITKQSKDVIRVAEATINPIKAQREIEQKELQNRELRNKKSLSRIAKHAEKRQQLSEFM